MRMHSVEFPLRRLFLQIVGFVYLGVCAFSIEVALTHGTPITEIGSGSPHHTSAALDLGLRRQRDGRDGGDGGGRSPWRWCLICSGAHPDNRECELTPRHVTSGPGKMNCTRRYCTSHVRYQPSAHLVHSNDKGISVPKRVLTPSDFEVVSIARGCEDRDKGNTCVFDDDLFGVTCFSTCATDFCNGQLSKPQWRHFIENYDERRSNKNNVVDAIRSYFERTGIKNEPKNQNEDIGGSRVLSTSRGSYKESDDDENEEEFHQNEAGSRQHETGFYQNEGGSRQNEARSHPNEAVFHQNEAGSYQNEAGPRLDEDEITEHKAKKHVWNNNNNNNDNGDSSNEGKQYEKSNSAAQKASLPNPEVAFVENLPSPEFQISEASNDDDDDDDDDELIEESPSYEHRRYDVIERAKGDQTGGGRLLELRGRRSESTEEVGIEDEVKENFSTSHSPIYSLNKGNPALSFAFKASPTVLLVPVCVAVFFASLVVLL